MNRPDYIIFEALIDWELKIKAVNTHSFDCTGYSFAFFFFQQGNFLSGRTKHLLTLMVRRRNLPQSMKLMKSGKKRGRSIWPMKKKTQ